MKRKGCPSKDHNKVYVVVRLKKLLISIPFLKNLIKSCSISDSLFDDLDLVTYPGLGNENSSIYQFPISKYDDESISVNEAMTMQSYTEYEVYGIA